MMTPSDEPSELLRMQLVASGLLEALKRVTGELELVARVSGSNELALVALAGFEAIRQAEALMKEPARG